MKISTKTIELVNFDVDVTQHDIDDGKCGVPSKCMEKLAIERTLRKLDTSGRDHRVRIDGAEIVFNMNNHQYRATTPKAAKRNLLLFDREDNARRKAQKEGREFRSRVRPHHYKVSAIKGRPIIPMTPERQKQINAARRRRLAEGRPDKRHYDWHKRVIGMGSL